MVMFNPTTMPRLTALICILLLSCAVHAKTWHVCPKDAPEIPAADRLKTIAEAASRVAPGDIVLIHSGTYRESVTLQTHGRLDAPITFAAAPGASVVMTGADRLTQWTAVPDLPGVYVTPWPHRFITWNKTGTHPDNDYHRLIGRCEQLFADNYPLRQVLQRDKLTRGTFYVDLDAKQLYASTAAAHDLTAGKVQVEAAVRDTILTVRADHVVIKGIRFRYAANRAQQGAVEFAGDHGRVEDCVFEYTNASGAEFRGQGLLVSRCTFQHNGQLGFGANRAHNLRMIDCTVRNNNTKGYDRGWEAGGNKICFTRGAVLEHCTFVENRGNGIWFDIGNENCTVCNCLIAHNENAGIFYEISYGLHAHDNVIIGNGLADTAGAWGANAGISLSSSPDCRIERNLLVGNREGFNFREQQRSTPRIDDRKGRPVWNHDNTITNNVIAYNRDAQTWGWFDVDDNRHWPAAGGQDPGALTLQKLNLTMKNNVYFADAGADLFNWGVTWKKHKRCATLDDVRRELALEQNSITTDLSFADFWSLDLRLPPDHPAIRSAAYPRGPVPHTKLGTATP
ncbi:MAG TPA: right-handed parallel beta-helix repeat-containing protein [Anaerohalosphaeraceae bacterium]|nr:right-handed parallel beta-helix repeat-containing protein [Anaerohalosphaeraceae bacterium]